MSTIELGPLQYAWLKSLVQTGPTRHCMEGAEKKLLRTGCAVKTGELLEATDMGRAFVRQVEGRKGAA
jgi:hypothetical protein